MKRHIEPIPAFTGAAYGTQPSTTLITRGRSIEYIDLQVIGSGPSAAVLDFRNVIASVELLHNGRVESVFYPKEEWMRQGYENATADVGRVDFLRIPIWRPGIPNSELGTKDLESVVVRVTTVPTAPASTTFTRIDGWMAYFDEDLPRAEYFVNTSVTPPNATPVAGDNVIDRLECNGITKLTQLFLIGPPASDAMVSGVGAGISRVKLEVDGRTIFDMTREAVTQFLAKSVLYYNAQPEYGFYVPLRANNDARDFVSVVNPDGSRKAVKLTYTFAGAAAPLRIHMEGIKGSQPAA